MTNQTQTVLFHNQQLTVLVENNQPHVAMKPICENIGLDWDGQRQRIKRHKVLTRGTVMITSPSKGGVQEYLCLPLSMLNGWLFGIDTNRVKPELREKLEQYQLECFDVLYEYWTTGEVKNKTRTTVDQRTPLRDAVNLLVSKKAITYSEAYSVVHQRFNVTSIEDLLPEQLPQAIEYVHKVALEGEYIPHYKEQSITLSLIEFYNLSWICNVARYMHKRIELITPALKAINSDYHGTFREMTVDHRLTILNGVEVAKNIIIKYKIPELLADGRYFPNLGKAI